MRLALYLRLLALLGLSLLGAFLSAEGHAQRPEGRVLASPPVVRAETAQAVTTVGARGTERTQVQKPQKQKKPKKLKKARRSPPKGCPIPTRLWPHFVDAKRETGLPLALLAAVAVQESGFLPEVVSGRRRSRAGAVGVMQLMPETADILGVDPQKPRQNILGGSRYLRQQLNAFGTLRLALSAYNAGPGITAEVGGPPYAETRSYVKSVVALKSRYRSCDAG